MSWWLVAWLLALSSLALFNPLTMPQLSPLGFMPLNRDMICWSGRCASGNLEHVRLQVCDGCRVARYCSRECQRVDWRRHKGQCAQAAAWSDAARRSIRPDDRMQVEEQSFSGDTLGLLSSDSNVLGAPCWCFLSVAVSCVLRLAHLGWY